MATLANKDVQNPALEVGVFDSVDDARQAVQGLLEAGFTTKQITVVCSDETKERYFSEFEHQDPAGTYTPAATIAGANDWCSARRIDRCRISHRDRWSWRFGRPDR